MNKKALQWIVSDDTGISSKTIWGVMMGVRPECVGLPSDADDFGRCYRLLELIPEWSKRLREVVMDYPEWRDIVRNWGELEDIFEADEKECSCPKFYKRIKELTPN